MSKFIIILTSIYLFTSCAYNRSTIYQNKEIELGISKNVILKKYGNPFKENLLEDKDGVSELLCYKEKIYVGGYEYILSTYFYFKNSKLIKKEQKEETPPYEFNFKSEKK